MLMPTVPDWSSDEEAPTHEVEARLKTIQCTVHPAHTTNNGIWMLAVMGAVTAITMMVITVTMMWMAAQGYAITGVWLTITLTRPYQYGQVSGCEKSLRRCYCEGTAVRAEHSCFDKDSSALPSLAVAKRFIMREPPSRT